MADRKGINGREVPGADLVATSSTTPPAGTGCAQRRRKGGRKHKRARASSDADASDATLVDVGGSTATGFAGGSGYDGGVSSMSDGAELGHGVSDVTDREVVAEGGVGAGTTGGVALGESAHIREAVRIG